MVSNAVGRMSSLQIIIRWRHVPSQNESGQNKTRDIMVAERKSRSTHAAGNASGHHVSISQYCFEAEGAIVNKGDDEKAEAL